MGDLSARLESLYCDYNRVDSASDPVHKVRPFSDPADREIAAFCAGALAFGRVASVLNSIDTLFAVIGPRPAQFVREFEPEKASREMRAMVHRWIRGVDLVALLWILRQMLERCGSIESFFLEGFSEQHEDVGPALDSFSTRAMALDLKAAYGRVPKRPGVCYFFPRPSAGSACKRLNLFLRWMVRKDVVDLGVWTTVSAARLIVPLDTHVIRLGRCLRLTGYASPGWKMAAEITESLRALDPRDPVKYDFALCHIGMADQCGFTRSKKDAACPLKGFCKPRGSSPPSVRR